MSEFHCEHGGLPIVTATSTSNTFGPVDVSVIAFEGNRFNGDVAPALAELQENGTVRIIDLTFIMKDATGDVSVVELADSGISEAFERITQSEFDLLSEDDLSALAEDLDANSSAMVIVWENTWATRLSTALRESHAEVAVMERIPRETVLAAFAALDVK
jgi:hypothetical protein